MGRRIRSARFGRAVRASISNLEIVVEDEPPPGQRLLGRAGAHITRVKAGHLTPITRPEDVSKVILSAADATT
jgi:hypothetical protein